MLLKRMLPGGSNSASPHAHGHSQSRTLYSTGERASGGIAALQFCSFAVGCVEQSSNIVVGLQLDWGNLAM